MKHKGEVVYYNRTKYFFKTTVIDAIRRLEKDKGFNVPLDLSTYLQHEMMEYYVWLHED